MTKPNVLFLTIDTLRADRLGCYGHTPSVTPNLDRLAAQAVRFEQAITGGSWTQAAFPVILTSSYASMYGGCLGPLSAGRPSPIKALAQAGYSTAGFSTTPLLSRAYGYQRGFAHFVDLDPAEKDPALRHVKGGQRLLRHPLTHYLAGALGLRLRPAQTYVSAEKLTGTVCHWLDGVDGPFFVWAHYMDVHWPYHREETLTKPRDIACAWQDLTHMHAANWEGAAVSDARRDHYIDLYEQALAYTDAQIGRLLDRLAEKQLWDNTIVVVLADHGEEFMEHGRWGHWENNLYDEILRVPLLIRLPNVEPQTVARQVRTVDVMPTLLDVAGCSAPEGVEGQSLRPLWAGGDGYNQTTVISEMWRDEWHIISLRTGTFKFLWDSQQPDSPQLFNLKDDPAERHNIVERHPQLVREFKRQIEAHVQRGAQTRHLGTSDEPDLDDEIVNRLRDLGYIE